MDIKELKKLAKTLGAKVTVDVCDENDCNRCLTITAPDGFVWVDSGSQWIEVWYNNGDERGKSEAIQIAYGSAATGTTEDSE